jgi:hypothetical protein
MPGSFGRKFKVGRRHHLIEPGRKYQPNIIDFIELIWIETIIADRNFFLLTIGDFGIEGPP